MENNVIGCVGKMCGFSAFTKEVACSGGNGSCWSAMMLEADESPFHDKSLQEATAIIRKALNSIPADPDGRKLSFVHTPNGTLLAWVTHSEDAPSGGLGYYDDQNELAKVLRIRKSFETAADAAR